MTEFAIIALAPCKLLAYISPRKVDVTIQSDTRAHETFAPLVESYDSDLFIQLALVGDFKLMKFLLLDGGWIVQKESFWLIAATLPRTSNVILHSCCDAKDTGIQMTHAIINTVIFGHDLGKVSKHSFRSQLFTLIARNDANDHFALPQSVVIFAKWSALVAPNIHQCVTCSDNQSTLLVRYKSRSDSYDFSRPSIPKSNDNDTT
mmetsp:Transcript_21371/g.39898  ORF Transcript_21371/g.39898 Transcript_21371/m.39898 type:complete len:205 (+) Transcript_21371:506-1120(+)